LCYNGVMSEDKRISITRETMRFVQVINPYSQYHVIRSRAWISENLPKFQVLEELGQEDAGKRFWKACREAQDDPVPQELRPVLQVRFFSQQLLGDFAANLESALKNCIEQEIGKREYEAFKRFRAIDPPGNYRDRGKFESRVWNTGNNALELEFVIPKTKNWPLLVRDLRLLVKNHLEKQPRQGYSLVERAARIRRRLP